MSMSNTVINHNQQNGEEKWEPSSRTENLNSIWGEKFKKSKPNWFSEGSRSTMQHTSQGSKDMSLHILAQIDGYSKNKGTNCWGNCKDVHFYMISQVVHIKHVYKPGKWNKYQYCSTN